MPGVTLCHVSAKCPIEGCQVEKHQYDPSSAREHAIEVVTAAMQRHLHEDHLEPCEDPYCRVCRGPDGEVLIP